MYIFVCVSEYSISIDRVFLFGISLVFFKDKIKENHIITKIKTCKLSKLNN